LIAACLLGFFAFAGSLSGQIVITVTGTAKTTAAGYTINNAYTFTFTSATSFVTNGDSSFGTTSNYWAEEDNTESQIWSSVSGGNLTGSYARPSGTNTSSFLQVSDSPALSFGVGVDDLSNANIGLVTPNTTLLGTIIVTLTGGTLPTFTYPNSFSNPVSYFAGFNGTYNGFDSADVLTLKSTSNSSLVAFAVTSVTINAAAVPEPAANTAALAAVALITVAFRRRQPRS
jgi:hypothetical protein